MHVNIKNGQHNHNAIVAANIVLCTHSIGAYSNMFLHCMYYAQMYAALLTILKRPIAGTLYWAWLVRVLSGLFAAGLSVCPGSACCLCCPLIL